MEVGMCVAADAGTMLMLLAKSVTKIWFDCRSTLLNFICVRSRLINGLTVVRVKMSSVDAN